MANVNKMDRFYEDANDQHVRSTIIYFDGTYACADVSCTTRIDGETLKNLFMKNELLIYKADTNEYVRPIHMQSIDGLTDVTAQLSEGVLTLFSAEYVPEGE